MDVTPLGERLVKVNLSGRLDSPGVDQVETRLTAAVVPGANNTIVDLTQVDFVASMGIRLLVTLARNLRTRGATLAIFGAQERVMQVFEAVALGKILSLCSTESEAMAAVASAPPTSA